MINIGSNIDVYSLYTQMMNDSSITLNNEREQYICYEVTRRKEMIDKYLLTNSEIINKYNNFIVLSGLYPEILAEGMGDYFIGRFKNIEEAFDFKDKVLETNKKSTIASALLKLINYYLIERPSSYASRSSSFINIAYVVKASY